MNFIRTHILKFLYFAIGLLAIAVGAVSFVAYQVRTELNETKITLEATRNQVQAVKNDVGVCTTELTALKLKANEPDHAKKDLQDQVEAFALQAKSCDALKKKLHVKD